VCVQITISKQGRLWYQCESTVGSLSISPRWASVERLATHFIVVEIEVSLTSFTPSTEWQCALHILKRKFVKGCHWSSDPSPSALGEHQLSDSRHAYCKQITKLVRLILLNNVCVRTAHFQKEKILVLEWVDNRIPFHQPTLSIRWAIGDILHCCGNRKQAWRALLHRQNRCSNFFTGGNTVARSASPYRQQITGRLPQVAWPGKKQLHQRQCVTTLEATRNIIRGQRQHQKNEKH
jgi:hypothetical protein